MEETKDELIIEVIEVIPNWILVQYETELDEGKPEKKYIQRKLIPWAAFPVARKGATRIPRLTLEKGMEYSNVALEIGLGESLPAILTCDITDTLRRAGIWTQEDYRKNPRKVAGVLQRLRRVDATKVLNAALRATGV